MSPSPPPASPKARMAAMRQGQQRAARERRREAVKKVRAYTAWLKAGSDFKRIPPVPTDADYRLMRDTLGGPR